MYIKIGDNQYELDFMYERSTSKKKGAKTIAILKGPDGAEWGRGISQCNPADSFEKAVGRKIALEKLVKSADVLLASGNRHGGSCTMETSRKVRQMVWHQYFKAINKSHYITEKKTKKA